VLQVGHVTPFKRLYAVQEVDAAGEKFVKGVARRLVELRWSGEIRVIKMTGKLKDPSALYIADPQGFPQEWRQRMEMAELIESPSATSISTTPALLPNQRFPVEALPAPLAAFVSQGAAALGCDTSYLALPVLTVAASLIGNSLAIRLKRDWTEPCVIWAAVIGDSGTLKSPAFRLVTKPVYRMQREMLHKYREEKTAYESVKAEYEKAVKKAQKEDRPPDDVLPDAPKLGRIITGDITIEKLGQLLADNPRGLLLCRDELRAWFTSFTRYKGAAGGSDLPNWLEFFGAGNVMIDRKTGDRPTLFIPHATVSICGGIQPGTLVRVLTLEAFDSGLAARFIMSMPPKRQQRWSEAEIDPQTQQCYEMVLRKLHALQPDMDAQGEPEPFVLRLTPEAKKVWIAFYDEWAKKQAEAEGELAAALSKLEAYPARFALIHHVVNRLAEGKDHSDPVEVESIVAGITLARWCADETERVYAVCRATNAEREIRRLIDYIRSHGGKMTARILHKSNRSRYTSPEAAEATLDDLVKAGCGEWSPTGEGGRPSRIFSLREHTPHPKSPKSSTDGLSETDSVTEADTAKGSTPCENPEENETIGVNGVWGKDQNQTNEPMTSLPKETESDEPFGASPNKDGEIGTDEEEGELLL
jgi:hypothetical protein